MGSHFLERLLPKCAQSARRTNGPQNCQKWPEAPVRRLLPWSHCWGVYIPSSPCFQTASSWSCRTWLLPSSLLPLNLWPLSSCPEPVAPVTLPSRCSEAQIPEGAALSASERAASSWIQPKIPILLRRTGTAADFSPLVGPRNEHVRLQCCGGWSPPPPSFLPSLLIPTFPLSSVCLL